MGRKAKLKKMRQQKKNTATSKISDQKYAQTQFVKQFEKMGYQLQLDPKLQPKTNRGNVSPEIPQDIIEPQL